MNSLYEEKQKKIDDEKEEKEKYKRAWLVDNRKYANFSPGLFISELFNFIEFIKKNNVKTILDAGIGSGKLFKKLSASGFQCHGIDISEYCLDNDLLPIKNEILTVGTLWDSSLFNENHFDAIVCTDVMEHIPTKYVKDVLNSFHKWTKKYLFLQIALVDDFFGEKVGHPLHLTVKPKTWWDDQLKQFQCIEYKIVNDESGNDLWVIYLLALQGQPII